MLSLYRASGARIAALPLHFLRPPSLSFNPSPLHSSRPVLRVRP